MIKKIQKTKYEKKDKKKQCEIMKNSDKYEEKNGERKIVINMKTKGKIQ